MFLPCLHSPAFQSKSGSEKRSRDDATFRGSLHGTAFAWENKRDKLRAKARKEIQKRSFWRRFWVLLPTGAKVPRAGARNVPFSLMLRRCRSISLPPALRATSATLRRTTQCEHWAASQREALEFRACGRGGAMYPKGTCSASLHCVGIAPYEIDGRAFVKRRAGAAECVRVMSLPPSRRCRDTSLTEGGEGFRACGRGVRIPTPVTSVTGSE